MMWEYIRRKIKFPLIILIIACSLMSILILARTLVKLGSNSDNLFAEEELPEVKESENVPEDVKLFIKEDSVEIGDKVFAKTEKLFDTKGLSERQKTFLGDNYDSLKGKLSIIEQQYEQVFNGISVPDVTTYTKDLIDISKEPVDIFSEDFLEGNKVAYNSIGGTVVGLHGTHCVVLQMNYNTDFASDLIVIDYSNLKLDSSNIGLFGFGQCRSFYVDPKYSSLVTYDGFKVLYTRGY